MEIESLLQIVMRGNEKYAAMLAKDIHFLYSILGEHPRYHVYLFLSLINNLVTNAVEAIEKEGAIVIDVCREEDRILLYVRDSGPGVKKGMNVSFLKRDLHPNMQRTERLLRALGLSTLSK